MVWFRTTLGQRIWRAVGRTMCEMMAQVLPQLFPTKIARTFGGGASMPSPFATNGRSCGRFKCSLREEEQSTGRASAPWQMRCVDFRLT